MQDLVVVGHLRGGCGDGSGVSLPTGKGSGFAPYPENFWIFRVRITCFGAFLALF